MKRTLMVLFAVMASVLCVSFASALTNAPESPDPTEARVRRREQRPISPEVHDDGSVTFRMGAPDADEAIVYTQFTEGAQSMKEGDDGIWSVTLSPARPGIYVYGFVVDGIEVADPYSRHVLANEWPTRSIVEIPGDEPMYYDQRPVPHGTRVRCSMPAAKTTSA